MKLSTCLVFAATALSLLTNSADARRTSAKHEPSGSYCGSYMANMVTGKVTMDPKSSTFDIAVKAFSNGENTCKGIQYALDAKSGHVVVPSSKDPKSCLGDMLASGGLSLDVWYDDKKDTVKLDLGIAKLTLNHC